RIGGNAWVASQPASNRAATVAAGSHPWICAQEIKKQLYKLVPDPDQSKSQSTAQTESFDAAAPTNGHDDAQKASDGRSLGDTMASWVSDLWPKFSGDIASLSSKVREFQRVIRDEAQTIGDRADQLTSSKQDIAA